MKHTRRHPGFPPLPPGLAAVGMRSLSALLLAALLALSLLAPAACMRPTPPAGGGPPGTTAPTSPATAPPAAAAPAQPPSSGALRLLLTDRRTSRSSILHANIPALEHDVSEGGQAVVGMGKTILRVQVPFEADRAKVDSCIEFSVEPSDRGAWRYDNKSQWCDFIFMPDQGETITVTVRKGAPLGGGAQVERDVVLTMRRVPEPEVALAGLEWPHVVLDGTPGVSGYTLPAGTWRFRATFSKGMAREAGQGAARPQVQSDLKTGRVALAAAWEDDRNLLLTLTCSEDAQGRVTVDFNGMKDADGLETAYVEQLRLAVWPGATLKGYPMDRENEAPAEGAFPIDAIQVRMAPDGRHVFVEEMEPGHPYAEYALFRPWLLEAATGQCCPIPVREPSVLCFGDWVDGRRLLLITEDDVYEVGVPDSGLSPSALAIRPLGVAEANDSLWGAGLSPDRRTLALARHRQPAMHEDLVLLDTSTGGTTVFPEVFSGVFFGVPQSDYIWSQPLTWVPGRRTILLWEGEPADPNRARVAFSTASGQREDYDFAGPGGRAVTDILAWSPDGTMAVEGGSQPTLVTAQGSRALAGPAPGNAGASAAFSPSGRFVALQSGTQTFVYDTATVELKARLAGWMAGWSSDEDGERVWVVEQKPRS